MASGMCMRSTGNRSSPRTLRPMAKTDLWLLCTMARDGRRSIYEPEATSTESAVDMTQERSRRSRMAAGRFMMASELDGLPTPFLWRVLSHKFGRLVLPFLLPVALVTSLALMRRGGVYRLAALSQLAGRPSPGPLRRIGKASAQFILGNYSVGIGVIRGARKAQPIRWDPVR